MYILWYSERLPLKNKRFPNLITYLFSWRDLLHSWWNSISLCCCNESYRIIDHWSVILCVVFSDKNIRIMLRIHFQMFWRLISIGICDKFSWHAGLLQILDGTSILCTANRWRRMDNHNEWCTDVWLKIEILCWRISV